MSVQDSEYKEGTDCPPPLSLHPTCSHKNLSLAHTSATVFIPEASSGLSAAYHFSNGCGNTSGSPTQLQKPAEGMAMHTCIETEPLLGGFCLLPGGWGSSPSNAPPPFCSFCTNITLKKKGTDPTLYNRRHRRSFGGAATSWASGRERSLLRAPSPAPTPAAQRSAPPKPQGRTLGRSAPEPAPGTAPGGAHGDAVTRPWGPPPHREPRSPQGRGPPPATCRPRRRGGARRAPRPRRKVLIQPPPPPRAAAPLPEAVYQLPAWLASRQSTRLDILVPEPPMVFGGAGGGRARPRRRRCSPSSPGAARARRAEAALPAAPPGGRTGGEREGGARGRRAGRRGPGPRGRARPQALAPRGAPGGEAGTKLEAAAAANSAPAGGGRGEKGDAAATGFGPARLPWSKGRAGAAPPLGTKAKASPPLGARPGRARPPL